MDMGTSTMNMASMTTSAAAAATTTAAMSMSMDSSSTCQISMLWNWYTVDACFIASSWHITSKSMFAGSCIGVILLVMSLEFLRRTSKEYDAYLLRQHQRASAASASTATDNSHSLSSEQEKGAGVSVAISAPTTILKTTTSFRPNVLQQAIRALLHMLQFAVAYFIMLLAMYFNGYIIICIIIGAYLGFFVFSWETVVLGGTQQQEATMCCG